MTEITYSIAIVYKFSSAFDYLGCYPAKVLLNILVIFLGYSKLNVACVFPLRISIVQTWLELTFKTVLK